MFKCNNNNNNNNAQRVAINWTRNQCKHDDGDDDFCLLYAMSLFFPINNGEIAENSKQSS